ncbi:heat shock protein HslJ [Kribbella aluminosa]|uniref:Heat shock protein HslJ n=1 Tax=Kribbella aluminosa TaxID=416017 RepID=A0ABS4UDS8_9ACTN|nr:META domain-containing protein [Kribbella aluminosa]MBP2349778.1 heat shock protein HslJ [Kribbella aluminosa]
MIALVGTGLLALTACGNGPAPGAQPGADLSGRTFLSTSVVENGKPRTPPSEVRLQFTTNGRLSWNAGCNSSETSVSTAGNRLVLGSEITSTAMGCLGHAAGADKWIGGVLTAKPTWKLDGDKLVVSTDSTTISLVDKQTAQPAAALDGTKWALSTIVAGQTASHPAGAEKAWLTLNGDRVTGSTGCNEFQGVVANGTGKLTFGELATTRRACTGDAAKLESLLLNGLKGDLTYKIDGSVLSLRSASGGLDFTARR